MQQTCVAISGTEGKICNVDCFIPQGQTDLQAYKMPILIALNVPCKVLNGKIEVLEETLISKKGQMLNSEEENLFK